MCGIAGKLDLTQAVERPLLERMCEMLEHRGPDARGIHLRGGVGLGSQRLAVIDLETGDQPIYSEDGSVVVVLNGEIYNYVELRRELQARGHRFTTGGDTETIAHLYEELGPRCVERLRGMFAFALWDERHRRLLLARDRVGKKPLYFRVTRDRLWFASEPRAMFEDPDVPREPNFEAIDAYLRLQYVPHPLSAFKGIEKLPPAHMLEWGGGEPVVSRYWHLNYEPEAGVKAPDAASALRRSLLEATRLRMRSDAPVGAFLSGGIDSSAVVAAMARSGGGRIKTFSVGFSESSHNESAYARQVAQRYGTEHRELVVGPDVVGLLPRLVWHYGEPFADSSALPTFALAAFARSQVTVALNGDGGDESFAGYARYVAQVAGERLGIAPRAVRGLLARTGAARYDGYVSIFARGALDELYSAEFASELAAAPIGDRLIIDAYERSRAPSAVERLLDVDIQTYLPCDLLVKMDIATMASSVEARSPFLDHVLMEEVARLRASLKLRGRRTKMLLKQAMRPWLPAPVIDRPKMGFMVPLASWLRGPLAQLPEEILLDPATRERGMFEPDRVHALIQAHRCGARDCSPELWSLIVLEQWFRTYIDNSGRSPATCAGARQTEITSPGW